MVTLRQAAQQALEALENHTAIKHPQQIHYRDAAIEALIEALAEPPQEPICPECTAKVLYECVACSRNNYPPQRKPLTEEEIEDLMKKTWGNASIAPRSAPDFARAIEQAHGIKGGA